MSSLLVPLSLSLSLSPQACSCLFYPLFWQNNRQPLVTHYGLFLERGGGWADDGGVARGRKKGNTFHFKLSSLKGTAWEQKLARVLEGLRYAGCSTMGLFTSSQTLKGPKWFDERINEWINFVSGCFQILAEMLCGRLHAHVYIQYACVRKPSYCLKGYGCQTTTSCVSKLLESGITKKFLELNQF